MNLTYFNTQKKPFFYRFNLEQSEPVLFPIVEQENCAVFPKIEDHHRAKISNLVIGY